MLTLVPHPPQATNDARNRKGSVSTFLRGTGRQSERVLSAQQDIGLLFKQMVEDVERNQATQARRGCGVWVRCQWANTCWCGSSRL